MRRQPGRCVGERREGIGQGETGDEACASWDPRLLRSCASSMKNSLFPSAPVMGEGSTATRARPASRAARGDVLEDARVDFGIAHDAAVADVVAAGFELGFHERDDSAAARAAAARRAGCAAAK